MDFAFVDVFTMENLIYNCRAIVFFNLTSILIPCRSAEIHGVIKAARSDPVGMQITGLLGAMPLWGACTSTQRSRILRQQTFRKQLGHQYNSSIFKEFVLC